MSKPPYEKPLDELRLVMGSSVNGRPIYVQSVQRKWEIQDGEPQNVMEVPTPTDRPFIAYPGLGLTWIPVRYEWRDLPCVTRAEVSAEKLAEGAPQISTT